MEVIITDQDIFHKDTEYIAHTYQRFPVAVRCGHGATAEDFEGNSYIDFGSGIGTNSLGFCNEGWVAVCWPGTCRGYSWGSRFFMPYI